MYPLDLSSSHALPASIGGTTQKQPTVFTFDTKTSEAELEFQYPNDWHIALTVTEFLVASDLRTWLAQAQNGHSPTSFLIPSILMTGSDKEKLNRFEPLVVIICLPRVLTGGFVAMVLVL